MEYIAYLHKDRNSDFGVSFPDFPGCITAGQTLEEARAMAAEALTLHIAGMVEDGETIPEPSLLDDVEKEVRETQAIPFMVSVEAPDATVRVNITVRESQLEKIDRLAEAAGLTRSAYMVRSAIAPAAIAEDGWTERNKRAHRRKVSANTASRRKKSAARQNSRPSRRSNKAVNDIAAD